MRTGLFCLLWLAGCTHANSNHNVDLQCAGICADLAVPRSDGGLDDLSGPGGDLPLPDLVAAPIVSVSIWIGGGGSAAAGARQLNVSIGSSVTVLPTGAASGAQFSPGFFASQTN